MFLAITKLHIAGELNSVEFLSFSDFGYFYFIGMGILIFDINFTEVTLRWTL